MMPTSRKTVAALIRSSVTTTAWVGVIGVRSARTTKVAKADSIASAAASGPSTRTARLVAGAATSAGVVCSTLAILVIQPREKLGQPQQEQSRVGANGPLMLLYNNVAELRQLFGATVGRVTASHPHMVALGQCVSGDSSVIPPAYTAVSPATPRRDLAAGRSRYRQTTRPAGFVTGSAASCSGSYSGVLGNCSTVAH